MTPDLEAFGIAIKAARLERGWTLEQLAFEVLGNQERKPYCSQIERGKRKLSALTIQKFAEKLEITAALTAPLLGLPLPEADERTETDDTAETLSEDTEALRDKLKLSEALAVALAYKYAEGNPTDIEGALKGLEAAFETAAEQKARDALPSNIDDAVDKVLAEVARLNDEGNPEDADAYLMSQIDQANSEMERQKAQLERYYDRAIAQAVLTRDADAYAERQLQRIQLGTPNAEDQWQALNAMREERYQTGLRTGAPFLLSSAIGLAGKCIAIAPSDHRRAGSHINLGLALNDQGLRTDGPQGSKLLSGAVEAYDTALTFFSQTEHPYERAMTQNNKGTALQYQGTRTEGAQGAELLAQAVAAYDSALEVRTRQDHPVHWAETQQNLAIAKEAWAEHDSAPDPRPLLTEALAHVDAALTVFDPEHMSYNHAKATRLRGRIHAKLDALS